MGVGFCLSALRERASALRGGASALMQIATQLSGKCCQNQKARGEQHNANLLFASKVGQRQNRLCPLQYGEHHGCSEEGWQKAVQRWVGLLLLAIRLEQRQEGGKGQPKKQAFDAL